MKSRDRRLQIKPNKLLKPWAKYEIHKRENNINIGLKYDTFVLKNEVQFLMLAKENDKTLPALKGNVQNFVFVLFMVYCHHINTYHPCQDCWLSGHNNS